MADKLMADIAGGDKKLQHVQTEDKSVPKIDSGVHIKENKHADLMAAVAKDHSLQHVETDDKSVPKIEGLFSFISLSLLFLFSPCFSLNLFFLLILFCFPPFSILSILIALFYS